FNLMTVLDAILAACSIPAEERGLQVAVSVAPGVPTALRGDSLRIYEIVLELVTNALKFVHQGGVFITVDTGEEAGSRFLRFEIRDTGGGMEEEQIAQLFQPFHQVGKQNPHRSGGTGLGLSICKRLVEKMNGSIGANSAVGNGSIFWFTIPLCLAEQEPAEEYQPQFHGHLHNRRILIIDQDETNRQALASMVTRFHAFTETKSTTAEAFIALQAARSNGFPFDLILLSVGPQNAQILESLIAVNQIRALDGLAQTPVLLIAPEEMDREQLANIDREGMLGVHSKPLYTPQFFRSLVDALNPPSFQWLGQNESKSQVRIKQQIPISIFQKRSALVVDDDFANRQVTNDFLSVAGMSVDCVSNGETALAVLDKKSYDVVLLDLTMPGMDGFITLRKIRELESGTVLPVMALTARSSPEDRDEVLANGFNAHLTKPVDQFVLYSALRNLLGKDSRENTT
ncbi:response regulator, partial [bacterium]